MPWESVGPAENSVLAALGTSGAAINVGLSGNLNLISTTISSVAGGGLLTAQDIPSFVVQTSTNLVDWTPFNPPLSTNAGGGFWFQFPVSSSPGGGFYRVLSQ